VPAHSFASEEALLDTCELRCKQGRWNVSKEPLKKYDRTFIIFSFEKHVKIDVLGALSAQKHFQNHDRRFLKKTAEKKTTFVF